MEKKKYREIVILVIKILHEEEHVRGGPVEEAEAHQSELDCT